MEQVFEFAGNHPLMTTALFASAIMIVVNEIRLLKSRGLVLTPAEAVRVINDGALVLDVRPPNQFEKGHLINARNIPLADLEQNMKSLEKSKNGTILACCDTGTTSGRAAGILRKAQFSDVRTLKGGLAAWTRDNMPLASGHKSRKKKDSKK